jgi:hypothetical protein
MEEMVQRYKRTQGKSCPSIEEGKHTEEDLGEGGRESVARGGKGKWCPQEVQVDRAGRLRGKKRREKSRWNLQVWIS